ncbi:MAG TPA: hypothetical protein VHE78_13455 [Gemmatimonadaceae bacterium]|nr:hypothetical protein [Gemmatimonadaceae bacterium]
MRSLLIVCACAWASSLHAQVEAPPTGPLALLLPASTRAMALGNAGVTGRDDDVIFYNPAQLVNVRGGFNASLARYGPASSLGAMSSSFTGGPLSLGWGVQAVSYSTRRSTYPFTPDVLTDRGSIAAFSMVAAVGAATTYKGFKIGTAAKYAEDRVSNGTVLRGPAELVSGMAAFDVGVAHNLWTGVAGLAVQNIGRNAPGNKPTSESPLQASLGWSVIKQVGELDVGFAAQLTSRRGWISPGAGLEAGYNWIEGYSLALRAGARRPETSAERPFSVGAAFNADRLALEYATQFFDGGRTANRMTLRWR